MTDAHGSAAAAAAWYADPHDPAQWRWWDGSRWTEHVSPISQAAEQAGAAQVVREAQAPAEAGSRRWPVPAIDAPLFPRDDYNKTVHPGFKPAHTALLLRRLPVYLATMMLGGVVMAIGAAVIRTTTGIVAMGLNICMHANWKVRDDSRDAPWAETFRRRGLDGGGGIHPRWLDMEMMLPILREASVQVRWCAFGEIGGMPATIGEYIATSTEQDGREKRDCRLFLAMEIPPLAAERHRGVSVRRRRAIKVPIGSRWSDGQQVELESIELAKSLSIEAHRSTDPVAIRELFGPQLVAALADRPVCWEQRQELLLVHDTAPVEAAVALDAFARSAAAVGRAYWADQD